MIQSEMNLSKQIRKEIKNCAVFAILFFLAVCIKKKKQKLVESLENVVFFLRDASVSMYRSTIQVYWTGIPNISHILALALGNMSYMSASPVLFATMVTFMYLPIALLNELKRR